MTMGHRALNARWGLLFWLLSAQAGCSWIGLRNGFDHSAPNPEQTARNQEFSEHAQEAIDRGDYEQARLELLRLAREAPASAEAQQRLGMVLQLEGRLEEAEACFRAALQRDPDYVEALIGLGQVEAQQGEVVLALKHLEAAHRDRPPPAEGPLLAGPAARIPGKNRRGARRVLPGPGVRAEQRRSQPEYRGHPVGAESA